MSPPASLPRFPSLHQIGSALGGGHPWRLLDLLTPTVTYERDGGDLARRGLYLDLPAWGHHVFEVTPAAR